MFSGGVRRGPDSNGFAKSIANSRGANVWRKAMCGGVVAVIGVILMSAGLVQAGFDGGMINVSFGGKDSTPVGKAVVGNEGDQWNAPDGHEGSHLAYPT